MRAVNLLPRDTTVKRKRLPGGKVLLAGTAPLVAAALVYVGFSLEHTKVSDAKANLGVVQRELAGLGPAAAVVSAGKQLAAVRMSRLGALQDALGHRIPWDVEFDEISRVLPKDAWLTSLTAQSPTPASAGAAPAGVAPTGASGVAPSAAAAQSGGLTLSGYAFSNEGVAHALARLQLVPSLTNVGLSSTSTTQLGNKTLVQFQITAGIVGGGGS